MSTEPSVNVTLSIPKQRIADLIIGAVEGGSNYWARFTILNEAGKEVRGLAALPDILRGQIIVHEIDESTDKIISETTIDLCNPISAWQKAVEGLQRMARLAPSHFGNFLSENDDAITADVYMQLVCLGEVKYG